VTTSATFFALAFEEGVFLGSASCLSHRSDQRSCARAGGQAGADGHHAGVQETGGNTAFPGYGAIGRIANVASRSTIARAIAILRATRWLTLCRRVRTPSGRFCANVYALHDEPLPLADACHLDADYRVFLRQAAEHTHRRVRAVAQGVL
jgi:hypothetical protein